MKPKILFTCALLAFFLGLVLLIVGWQGSSSVTAAWPISGSAVQLSGSAKGWRAMAGLGGLVLALILFLWGLVSLATRLLHRKQKEPLPEPQVGTEAKKQVASQ